MEVVAEPRRRPTWRGLVVAGVVVLGLPGIVVAHDLYRSWSVDPHGSDFGALCEREDHSVWRDPSMGCGQWEDPQCRYDRPCQRSRMIGERVVSTGSWFFWTERRLTGPDPWPGPPDAPAGPATEMDVS